jgi:hypothetical protein
MLRDGVDQYHSLLTDDMAGETQRQLDEQLKQRGLFFGDRALCTVLRPRFLSPAQYKFLQKRGAVVLRAFRTVHQAALSDAKLLAQFRLMDWEHQLVHVETGFRDASPVSRLDAFFVAGEGGMKFTEYNAETPAGGGYNDVLTEVFYGLPIMREFLRVWDVRPLPARHNVLHALLDAYEQWSGTRNRPSIAIVDWSDVPTQSEFLLFQDYFVRQGIPCTIIDPSEVSYTNGELTGPHGKIDLIYKRVLLHELVERGGIDHPILRAFKDGKVCMVNPPACKILHKKASLAALHDERNSFLSATRSRRPSTCPFHGHESSRSAIRRTSDSTSTCCPSSLPTRINSSSSRTMSMAARASSLVGRSTTAHGRRRSRPHWPSRTSCSSASRCPREDYPSFVDGKAMFIERMVDTAPYVAYR